MVTLIWREATSVDEAPILSLMRAFYAEDHLVFNDGVAVALRELLASPEQGSVFLLTGESSGEAGGYFVVTLGYSLEFHGRYALLDELYLAPACRRQGWARQGLTVAETWCRSRGVACLRLEVNQANTRARAFYLTAGFGDDRRDLLTRRL